MLLILQGWLILGLTFLGVLAFAYGWARLVDTCACCVESWRLRAPPSSPSSRS
jgi:hypothetical protein